jgi:hypothetical protein
VHERKPVKGRENPLPFFYSLVAQLLVAGRNGFGQGESEDDRAANLVEVSRI